jgi:2-polyprenyl-3-methyl-5-hydroxy-6-metoxy-1,4-benzoquinol methylase
MVDQLTVRVRRRTGPHMAHVDAHVDRDALCTTRFCTTRRTGVLDVAHDLRPEEMSDDLAELLAKELDDSGVLRGQPEFEAVFTGVIESTLDDDGGDPWYRFYLNSVDRLERGDAAFAPIHEHAASLVIGNEIIDLGSCFGFFPLRAAAAGLTVTATDLSAPTMRLLDRMSVRLRRPLRTIGCNATTVPLPDRSADTVTVLHLLEHIDVTTAAAVLDEALRLARRRVIVAVPFEDVPRACYGHVQRFDMDALCAVADARRATVARARAHEFHGGWLVLDR